MLLIITAIALGGALGALARYGLSLVCVEYCGQAFPYATLTVNALGCLLLGLAASLLIERFQASVAIEWRLLFITGFLGSFTTFSTFTLETYQLLVHSEWLKASLNIGVNVTLCLLLLLVGLWLGKLL